MLSARFEPEAAQTEGGEALPVGAMAISDPVRDRIDRDDPIPGRDLPATRWDALRTRVPVLPHAYLHEGQRVRIVRGPFTDVEGVLVRQNPTTGLLVLSVQLLRQSVAVEVDCTWAVPA